MEKPKVCILIDDDVDEHEIFEVALKGVNMPVKLYTATTGQEILEKLDTNKLQMPDFIFLDLNMPKMDGKQFLTEIKKRPLYRQIPVIIYSTSSEERDVRETKKLGAAAYVTKQIRIHVLTKILSDILKAFLKSESGKQTKKVFTSVFTF